MSVVHAFLAASYEYGGGGVVGVVEEDWGPMRDMDQGWYENIKRQCDQAGIPCTLTAGVTYATM